jgi:hypothetical protein
MGNHKNHGIRPPRINGFRDGKAPAIVPTQSQVTYRMGLDAESKYVVVEWNKPITNLQMLPAAVDDLIKNLQGAKAALLDAQAKKAQG